MIEVHVTIKDTETDSSASFVANSQVGIEDRISRVMQFVWVGSVSTRKQMSDYERDLADMRSKYGSRSRAFVDSVKHMLPTIAPDQAVLTLEIDGMKLEVRNRIECLDLMIHALRETAGLEKKKRTL